MLYIFLILATIVMIRVQTWPCLTTTKTDDDDGPFQPNELLLCSIFTLSHFHGYTLVYEVVEFLLIFFLYTGPVLIGVMWLFPSYFIQDDTLFHKAPPPEEQLEQIIRERPRTTIYIILFYYCWLNVDFLCDSPSDVASQTKGNNCEHITLLNNTLSFNPQLGSNNEITKEQITAMKSAYRRFSALHHPDKLSQLSDDDERKQKKELFNKVTSLVGTGQELSTLAGMQAYYKEHC